MLFNSIDFAIFLPIVFILYWFVTYKSLKLQNLLIAIASYVFYGWWDWRFLILITFSLLVDYIIGVSFISTQTERNRKILLWISIIVNLGLLGLFKYYNFFVESFIDAFTFFGSDIRIKTIEIILPVGISFYTFQTMSYSIDVYKRKLEPTKDMISFMAFVSFFPQLVAGPIERASNLLPQFYKKRHFKYENAIDGLRQILWGLFKKVVIADNCAYYADLIFNNSENYSGSSIFIGALFFTFQIYCDFSGYSDIAIGVARLFGFELMKNFSYPYFSRDIPEFWRRWHISLSTWFRDYLYFPLGGSKGSKWTIVRNTFIVFLVSGFWHGANWTYVFWGLLNAFYFLPYLLLNKNRINLNIIAENTVLPSIKEALNVLITFILIVLSWIFFRAENMSHALDCYNKIFSISFFKIPYFKDGTLAVPIIILIIFFVVIEWLGRREEYAIAKLLLNHSYIYRWLFYYILLIIIFIYSRSEQQFIYFQF